MRPPPRVAGVFNLKKDLYVYHCSHRCQPRQTTVDSLLSCPLRFTLRKKVEKPERVSILTLDLRRKNGLIRLGRDRT
jgi:hypothetical protein